MAVGGQRRLNTAGLENIQTDVRFLLAARCGIYMLLGAAMSWARVLQSGAPFGMAFVACSGSGITGVFALTGAAIGYLLSGGIEWGIRYIAASVLIYTVSFVFHETEVYHRTLFMPFASAAVMGLTGFLSGFSGDSKSVPEAAELFLEMTLAFGGAYFFKEALRADTQLTESAEVKHSISGMIMLSCLLMSISAPALFGMLSLGRFLALILVMGSAMKGGLLTGAAVGTVFGIAMDAANNGSTFYTMSYAFSGLLSGVFGRHGRFIFTLSFLLASALSVICAWDGGANVNALFEVFCAGVIFMLLPQSFMVRIGMMLQQMEKGSGESDLRRFVAGRVQQLSDAYGELYETVRRNADEKANDADPAKIFDRAADEVCIKCRFKNRCWNAEYVDTLNAMNDATAAMTEHGSLDENDLPEFFRAKCVSLPAYVAAVNGELRALSFRRQLQSCLNENRRVAWGQYRDVSDMLAGVAQELGSLNGTDSLVERRIRRYLKSLELEADVSVYHDGAGRMHVNIESGRLTPLLRENAYLDRLSKIAGTRLCRSGEGGGECSRLCLLEAEPLAVSVGIASMKKKGEKVSGDKGTYFKTDAGVLCVILADGMGCGDEAAQDSTQVTAILEKFLRSGVEPAVAMKILNSVLLLRSNDSWGYTTVDLMCVNLFTGETCFYKYGAAPSYIKSGKSIRRIKCETLAAGLSCGEGTAPDTVRMRLKPGSTAVIASDGVLADGEDEWLKALMNREFEDMKALARAALRESEHRYGTGDDMTVVTVRVEERA